MTTTPIRFKVARKKGDKTTPELHFDFGQDVNASIILFGGETVHALFVSAARQQLTDWARKLYTRKKQPLSLEQLQAELDTAVFAPGLKKRGKSTLEKAASFLDAMTFEERVQLAKMAQTFAPAQKPTSPSSPSEPPKGA